MQPTNKTIDVCEGAHTHSHTQTYIPKQMCIVPLSTYSISDLSVMNGKHKFQPLNFCPKMF
jgi:hypothetical protein